MSLFRGTNKAGRETCIGLILLFQTAFSGNSEEESSEAVRRLYRVTPRHQEDLNTLRDLEEAGFDFWSMPSTADSSVEISVETGSTETALLDVIRGANIPCQIIIGDLSSLVKEEAKFIEESVNAEQLEFRDPSFNFERYHDLEEIEEFIDDFILQNPEISEKIPIGKTFEGRDLNVIKLFRKEEEKNKTGIWIDCGVHAREWISPAFCLFALDRFANVSPELMDYFDLYVLPVMNPDGYVYSWKKDRLWRKNRRVSSDNSETRSKNRFSFLFDRLKNNRRKRSKCVGVDINRNFGIKFNTIGSSTNPCSNTFHGERAFSETESSALRDFLTPIPLSAFFTIHSYSQILMSPYAYQKAKPLHYEDHLRVMQRGVQAIEKETSQKFRYGPISKVLSLVGGGSPDWAYEELGVKYTFAVEMRDRGDKGFLLPAEQIEPATRETWKALEAMILEIAKEYI